MALVFTLAEIMLLTLYKELNNDEFTYPMCTNSDDTRILDTHDGEDGDYNGYGYMRGAFPTRLFKQPFACYDASHATVAADGSEDPFFQTVKCVTAPLFALGTIEAVTTVVQAESPPDDTESNWTEEYITESKNSVQYFDDYIVLEV